MGAQILRAGQCGDRLSLLATCARLADGSAFYPIGIRGLLEF